MLGLGRVFDIGVAWVPVDLDAADGSTGKRIYVGDCGAITFVMVTGTGPATASLDVQQATASSGGTSGDLDVVTSTWYKSETALDNDEVWTEITQSAASEITLDSIAATQKLVTVCINVDDLTDGYAWVSVNSVSANGTAHLAGGLYLKHDLKVQRHPSRLPNLLDPTLANA